MKQHNDSRQEFEAWAVNEGLSRVEGRMGGYLMADTAAAWKAWQAQAAKASKAESKPVNQSLYEAVHEALGTLPSALGEDDGDTQADHIMEAIRPYTHPAASVSAQQAEADLVGMVMKYCGNPRGVSEAAQELMYETALQIEKKTPSTQQAEAEPVATILTPDPLDERDGPWMRIEDRERLANLPAGTKLYTPAPAPVVPEELVKEVMEDQWNDYVGDAQSIPPDIKIHGPPTTQVSFQPSTWAGMIARGINMRLAAAPQPEQEETRER